SVAEATPQARRDPDYRVLRQALGYGWSVAVVALPDEGKFRLERWLASRDLDVRWIMRENLRKNRLTRLDPAWVARCSDSLNLTPALTPARVRTHRFCDPQVLDQRRSRPDASRRRCSADLPRWVCRSGGGDHQVGW